MTNERLKLLRRIYGILLSVSIAAAGICLIWACVGIYRTGDHPFSREVVAAAFSPIAVPVYLCLGLVILGFLLDLFLPEAAAKRKGARNCDLLLKKLRSRVDLSKCSEELQVALIREANKRRKDRGILTVLLGLGTVVFLCFALQPDAFHQSQINGSMIRNISFLACCMAPAFCFAIYGAYHSRRSMEAEIALLKTAPAEAKVSAQEAPVADRSRLVRNVIAVLALAFLIYGFCAGGTADVLTKAVNICTECVGLG
ncbi:MAG: hypothetical protein IJ375_07010 [Oscillospiraceae bacterium]|nr:hypothetical protein [Oscillospiraceae bacterium]